MNQGHLQIAGLNCWTSPSPPPCHLSGRGHTSSNDQEFPSSWSQLLIDGDIPEDEEEEEEKLSLNQMEISSVASSSSSSRVEIEVKQENACFQTSDLKRPSSDLPSNNKSNEAWKKKTKKPKAEAAASTGHGAFKIQVRKEKLGERITALHHLVSPFGKTDTASVLLEAIGYIRFLQSQIQALSLPYTGIQSVMNISRQNEESSTGSLRSRGLCLVPTSTIRTESIHGGDHRSLPFAPPSTFPPLR